MLCAWEGRRKPESHALVCFRTLVRSCVATACCHLRLGCDCSPALWSQPMILGGFDAFLLRCVRWYVEDGAFRMLCGQRGRRISSAVTHAIIPVT